MPEIVGSIDNIESVPVEEPVVPVPEPVVPVPEPVVPVVEPVIESSISEEQPSSEELTPETELWEGGPTKAELDAWKAKYGDVYLTEVGGESRYIIWRTLARAEYRNLILHIEKAVADEKISREEANLDNEDAIAKLCILYPDLSASDAVGKELGGLPSLISQQVMEASAFVSYQVRKL